jgi:thiamine-phosphate pyrophosphorylase
VNGVVLLTDRRIARRPLVDVVEAAVAGGVRWVVLREKDLPRPRRAALAAHLRALLRPVGGRLVVAGPDPLDGDAVHLPAGGPFPPPPFGLVGRSCHDAVEAAKLSTEHYAFLSPVFPTATKPGYGPPLLPDGLAALGARVPVPWLALGGVDSAERAAACAAAGAGGVAVLGAVMRAADPARVVRALFAGLGAPPRVDP